MENKVNWKTNCYICAQPIGEDEIYSAGMAFIAHKSCYLKEIARQNIDLNKPVKIDIGAGDKNQKGMPNEQDPVDTRDEWIHIDGVQADHIEIVCDFAEIPIPTGIADEIFSGDTIEHIRTDLIDKTLREWNRILKIGGVFSGRCPNLHSTMIRYAKGELSLQDATGALYGSQDSIWQQHYVTYTADTLKVLLEKYGFGEVDLTGSPGYDPNTQTPNSGWWLVWKSKKISNVNI